MGIRWKNREEAMDYIHKCFQTNNFGLSYCAACDFVGIENPAKYKEEMKQFRLGIWADCILSLSNGDVEGLIDELKYDVYNSEYVEGHRSNEVDDDFATVEEYLDVAKNELKVMKSYESEDETLVNYVIEMIRIKDTQDSDYIVHNLGRVYNDAVDYVVATYQVNGEEAMNIVDELMDKYDK